MSATLNNLLIAARLMAGLNSVPVGNGSAFQAQLDEFEALDRAREQYYQEEESRKIFDWVQQYHAIKSFYGMPLPLELENTPFPPAQWAELEEKARNIGPLHAQDDYLLDRIDTWLLECYSLKGRCEVLPGDVVLDCGAFTGNTALYFSRKCGENGHVYSLEPGRASFLSLQSNVAPLGNVTPIQAAVSSASGRLSFTGGGGGARLDPDGTEEVDALSIDDLVQAYGLQKIDFIKMDVEGAEREALLGAKESIARFRPRMALSAYHRDNDCLHLPDTVEEIAPGAYRYALRHYSNLSYETVLFCIPKDTAEAPEKARPVRPRNLREAQLGGIATYLRGLLDFTIRCLRSGTSNVELKELTSIIEHSNRAIAEAGRLRQENDDLKRENRALQEQLAEKRPGSETETGSK